MQIKYYLKFKFLLYFLSLVAAWPWIFSLIGFLPNYKVTYLFLFPVIILYAIIKNATYVPRPISSILVIQGFVWIFYWALHLDTSYITRLAVGVTTFFLIGIQYKSIDKDFIRLFTDWQLLQVVLGSIGFILVLCNLLHPLFIFTESDGRPGAFYGLFATNTFQSVCRNAGYYDEPGALACWGMYALLFNKLFIKNRRTELILLIGLITTLSLAYFIQVILYLFLFYKDRWKQILIIGALMFAIVKGLSSFNENYYSVTIERLEYDEETGSVKGDNRITQLAEAKRIFEMSPIIGVGASNLGKLVNKEKDISSNIVSSLAADGILGFIIIYLPLFLLFKYGLRDRKYLYAAIILFFGYYQRPFSPVFVINVVTIYSMVLYAYLELYEFDKLSSDYSESE